MDLLEALRGWHSLTWYYIKDQAAFQVPLLGVRPGASLADLICVTASARFYRALVVALRELDMLIVLPLRGNSLLVESDVTDHVELLPPAYLGDLFISVEDLSSRGLLEKVIFTMVNC